MSYRRSATPRRCFRIRALSPARVTRGFIHYAMSDAPPSDADTRCFVDGQGIGSDAAAPCLYCHKKPSFGSKFKTCGGCTAVVYCSDACQQADWPRHKKFCKEMKETRKKYKGVLKAGGEVDSSRQEDFKWFCKPGRAVTCQLLAWKYRDLTPLIITSGADSDGEPPYMLPRHVWDKERKSNIWSVAVLKQCCDRENFEETQFLLSEMKGNNAAMVMSAFFLPAIIAIGDIVNALTSRVDAEEVGLAQSVMASYLSKKAGWPDAWKVFLELVHDDDMRRKYLHAFNTFPFDACPSRENNRWLGYILMGICQMDLNVTIVGLKSATHLNGREAVIHASKQTCAKFDDKRIVVTRVINTTFECTYETEDVCIKPANFDLSVKPTVFDHIAQIAAEAKVTGKPVKVNPRMMATMSDTFVAEYFEAVTLLLINAPELISLPAEIKRTMAAM